MTVVEVDGHQLSLSNLDKVLYPKTGFTKGEVIDYYARIAPVMLPHLQGRPMTFRRYPNGVDAPSFFEKNASRATPDWVRRVTLPVPGSTMNRETIDFVVVDELATLVFAANLAALEMHTPQWKVDALGKARGVDRLVIDLDPGAPADVVTCAEVSLIVRDRLAADGLEAFAKTSGSKGLQMYAALRPSDADAVSTYVRGIAEELEAAHPDLVLSRMTRSLRGGKVFLDWSQNNGAKTTVAAYSLRARPRPTVSTPVTWDEVGAAAGGAPLSFTQADVLARIADGDLFEPLLAATRPELPPA